MENEVESGESEVESGEEEEESGEEEEESGEEEEEDGEKGDEEGVIEVTQTTISHSITTTKKERSRTILTQEVGLQKNKSSLSIYIPRNIF